ncbi:MAG: hypothetical protein AAGC95_06805 [Pseudomonadota bacterium]
MGKILLGVSLMAIAVAGCSTSNGIRNKDGLDPRIKKYMGADMRFENEPLRKIDLVSLIDPENRRTKISGCIGQGKTKGGKPQKFDPTEEFNCALRAFDTYYMSNQSFILALDGEGEFATPSQDLFYQNTAKSEALAVLRNKVQDTIIVHSEEYCRVFKLGLSDRTAGVNFVSGGLTTLLGGLGAIFTDPSLVRALSGSAGVVSGVRGQYNEAYLAGKAVATIVKGIDLRRDELLRDINKKRFFVAYNDTGKDGAVRGANDNLQTGMRNIYGINWVVDWNKLYNAGMAPQNQTATYKDLVITAQAEGAATAKNAAPKKSQSQNVGVNAAPKPEQMLGVTSVTIYSLETALRDAIKFHSACTIDVGLDEAVESIEAMQNPSLDVITTVLESTKNAIDKADEIRQTLEKMK